MNTLFTTAVLALLFSSCQAEMLEDVFIETQTFGSHTFHEIPQLSDVTTAGLVVGWTLFSIVVVVAGVWIIKDTCERHSDYGKKVESARQRMRELGIDIAAADRKFERRMKGIKDEDEDDQLLNAAAEKQAKV